MISEIRLGVDPGLTGGISLLCDDQVLLVWDMPTMAKTHGKGNQVNPYILADIFREAQEIAQSKECKLTTYIERVSAMPGQGVTSMFGFGRSMGVVEGVAATLGLRVIYPTPQAWKRRAGLTGKPKDASRTVASSMFPEIATRLSRKKDIGVADAILIAAYGC